MTTEIQQSMRVLLGATALLLVAGCSPPDERTLSLCRKSSAERAEGSQLAPADIGELTEACMAKKGYSLEKAGRSCAHDLSSQSNRRCYFPDTTLGHLYAALPKF